MINHSLDSEIHVPLLLQAAHACSKRTSEHVIRDMISVSSVTVTVTVTNNLFKYELQKSPALPPQHLDYYADHDSEQRSSTST